MKLTDRQIYEARKIRLEKFPIQASIVEAAELNPVQHTVTLEIPTDEAFRLWGVNTSDDAPLYAGESGEVSDLEWAIPSEFDGAAKYFKEAVRSAAYSEAESSAQDFILSQEISYVESLYDGVSADESYEYMTDEGMQVIKAPESSVQAAINHEHATITIVNPEHLFNRIIDGVGAVPADINPYEEMTEEQVKAQLGTLSSFYDVYGGKPKQSSDGSGSADFSKDYFQDSLKTALSIMTKEEAVSEFKDWAGSLEAGESASEDDAKEAAEILQKAENPNGITAQDLLQ